MFLEDPPGWTVIQRREDGCAYANAGLRVIVSEAPELDGHLWRHVSVSRANVLPSWDEMRQIKDTFIGPDREAYQVFPTEDRYVNINEVLHLWCCLDVPAGRVLPDFTRGGPSI